MRRRGHAVHDAVRAIPSRSGTRGLQIAVRREEDAGAHPVHVEDGEAAEELAMREVVIASSVRTPVGKAFKGTLRATRPDNLAAVAIRGALDRVPQLDPKEI